MALPVANLSMQREEAAEPEPEGKGRKKGMERGSWGRGEETAVRPGEERSLYLRQLTRTGSQQADWPDERLMEVRIRSGEAQIR